MGMMSCLLIMTLLAHVLFEVLLTAHQQSTVDPSSSSSYENITQIMSNYHLDSKTLKVNIHTIFILLSVVCCHLP